MEKKPIVTIYFETKTSKFCFEIVSFSSLESQLSLDWEDSEINFDRARFTPINSLLRALRAICNIYFKRRRDEEDFFAEDPLVY